MEIGFNLRQDKDVATLAIPLEPVWFHPSFLSSPLLVIGLRETHFGPDERWKDFKIHECTEKRAH